MKIKVIILILIIATAISCNKVNKESVDIETQEIVNETPDVLVENSNFKLSSYSKRYDSNIITKLFNEALEKDAELEQLNNEITLMYQFQNDSLPEFSKFDGINKNYWRSSLEYIEQIEDTILRKSSLEIFETLQSKYEISMADYDQKIDVIKKKTITLNDQLILMKLFITEPMIKKYQLNEKPDIRSLENIIKEYDKLINETQEYTKIVK